MKEINILGRKVGKAHKPLIIAEVAQAHDGSLGLAHCFIDAVAGTGADAIKFQTHIAESESTLDEQFRVKFSQQDETRFDYWKRMEFSKEQWAGLAEHAREKGLLFLSSPFSKDAVELLDEIGVGAWKIGSGEFWSDELLSLMLGTHKPLLISTGMSRWDEIHKIAQKLQNLDYPFALFQCTSRYPTPLDQVGLNVIGQLKQEINCPVGLSDHSGVVYPALAALSRGVNILEFHVTLSRRMFGPDVTSSLTIDDISHVVQMRDALWKMDNHPVNKDEMSEELSGIRDIFSKSVGLTHSLSMGMTIERKHICAKKPGTGIPVDRAEEVIGKVLKTNVNKNRLLAWEDLL